MPSYEEANWARLSPKFRKAHNAFRQARGLPMLPPPENDLYLPLPRTPLWYWDETWGLAPDLEQQEFAGAWRQFLATTAGRDWHRAFVTQQVAAEKEAGRWPTQRQ